MCDDMLTRLERMHRYMSGFCYTFWAQKNQTHAVESAPAMKGSVFLQRFRILWGQCRSFESQLYTVVGVRRCDAAMQWLQPIESYH